MYSQSVVTDCVCSPNSYPFYCHRYKREMHKEVHGICQGTFLPEQRERYIATWERLRDGEAVAKPVSAEFQLLAMPCPHRLTQLREVECTPCKGGPQPVYGCELYKECVKWGNSETQKQKIKACGKCDYLPENLEEQPQPELSITMAVYDDYDGAWSTVMALLMYHNLDDCEIVVGDNNPDSPEGKLLRDVCLGTDKVRYVTIRDVEGSSLPKDRVIREARGKAVLHLDCHVFLELGIVDKLKAHYREHPETMDLWMGPILHRPGRLGNTHQNLIWRGGNFGAWGTDPRGLSPAEDAFEIPQMGTGLYSFRREAWHGYHPLFHGYGGNETYLMEQYRRRGHRVMCLPWLRWLHRFGHPSGTPYENKWSDKCRNYLITLDCLGMDRTPMLEHYKKAWGTETKLGKVVEAYETEFPLVTCVGNGDITLQDWPHKEQKGEPGTYSIEWESTQHHESEITLQMRAIGFANHGSKRPIYEELLEQWKTMGGDAAGSIPRELFSRIGDVVSLTPGLKTLEFGAGLSTWLFDRLGCDHLALESSQEWANRVNGGLRRKSRVLVRALVRELHKQEGEPSFYDWEPAPHVRDVILIDGPFGTGNRVGCLRVLPKLVGSHTVIFVDDTQRPKEYEMALEIAKTYNKSIDFYEFNKRGFAVLHGVKYER